MVGATLVEILAFNFWTLPLGLVAGLLGFLRGRAASGSSHPAALKSFVRRGLFIAGLAFVVGLIFILVFQQATPIVVEPLTFKSSLMLIGAHLLLDLVPAVIAFLLGFMIGARSAASSRHTPRKGPL